jgi:hypothetical protein
MTSCRRARGHIVDAVRGAASEAARLELDVHLQACAPCRTEHARWELVSRLKDAPARRLDDLAHQRIVRNLRLARVESSPATSWALSTRWALGGLGVAALALAVWIGRPASVEPPAPQLAIAPAPVPSAPARFDGESVSFSRAGTVAYGGAQVAADAGARVRLGPGPRAITFEAGRIDVDVAPGGDGRFMVRAPRFTVEVLGTRFVVTEAGVRTLHGTVRVADLEGRELALLNAGDAWDDVRDAPPPKASAPSARPRAKATERDEVASVEALLGEARSHLADGDVSGARGLLLQIDGRAPDAAQRAARDLLAVDALRVEGRLDAAVTGYRNLAARLDGTFAGESAAFLAAEVLARQGRRAEAAAAFSDYLARHPEGRFAEEARARAAELEGR